MKNHSPSSRISWSCQRLTDGLVAICASQKQAAGWRRSFLGRGGGEKFTEACHLIIAALCSCPCDNTRRDSSMASVLLSVDQVSKSYGARKAVDGVSFKVHQGQT